ncbi:STAS domain-containing protein [uncultured Jatrophihabitans sp.]|uniref:STAS domain-containing protein n=1 Tax=uncultured Jatrophihabitans sp. TaxID=1610747 RepID=UPI0035CA7D17
MSKLVELAWAGDVDLANITPIRHELDEALDTPDVERLVIDLGAVGFVDSLGLGMLVYAMNTAQTRGIAMSVRHVPPRTQELIDVAGLSQVLAVERD